MTRKPMTWTQYELPRGFAGNLELVDGDVYVANRNGGAAVSKTNPPKLYSVYSHKFGVWIHRYEPMERSHRKEWTFFHYFPVWDDKRKIWTLDHDEIVKTHTDAEIKAEWDRLARRVDFGTMGTIEKVNHMASARDEIERVHEAATKAAAPKATNGHAPAPEYTNDLDEFSYRIWDWVHDVFLKEFELTDDEVAWIDSELGGLGVRPRTRSVTITMVVPDGTQFEDINELLKTKSVEIQSVETV